MKRLKKLVLALLCVLMVLSLTLPTFAVEARLSHGVIAQYGFNITPTGYAEWMVNYGANTTSFTHITVETYIQKRSLGFIWTKVDNGEENKTWVETSTALDGLFCRGIQLDSTGTYRAVIKITFSGTGAADDVIEDKVEAVYE